MKRKKGGKPKITNEEFAKLSSQEKADYYGDEMVAALNSHVPAPLKDPLPTYDEMVADGRIDPSKPYVPQSTNQILGLKPGDPEYDEEEEREFEEMHGKGKA